METFLVFASSFSLLAACAAPSISFGDSGELAAAAASLGLPHAPSYPLYVLAARAFGSALGLGGWGYRVNLFSAFCGALSLSLLCDAARRLGASRPARLAACALLALSPLFLRELGVAEVFGLHVLAVSAVAWLLCSDAPTARRAGAMGLVFGLGAGNHHTLALAGPAVVLAAALERPGAAKALRAASCFLGFLLLGAAVYAYLPLRAAARPALDWGHPATLPAFMHVLLRRDYGSMSLTVDGASGGVWAQAVRFVSLSWRETPALLLLGLGGLLLSTGSGTSGKLWVLFLALGPAFLMLGRPPFDPQTAGALPRFLLAPLAVLAVPAAGLLTRAAWLALPAAGLLAFAPPASSRWDLAAYDYGRAVLRSVPPGAALFMDGGDDTFYSVAFLQQALGLRPDVEPHDRGGLVFSNAYGPDFRSLPRAEKEMRRRQVEAGYAAQGRLFYSTLGESVDPSVPLETWGLLRRPKSGRSVGSVGLGHFLVERWSEDSLSRYRDRALVALYPYMRAARLREDGRRAEALDAYLETAAVGGDALWARPNAAYGLAVIGYDAARAGELSLSERAFALSQSLKPDDSTAKNLAAVRAKLAGGRR